MKKTILTVIALLMCLALVSCQGGQEQEQEDIPPAFSLLQRQTTLSKHSQKGESASFSSSELESLLGEKPTCITITELPEKQSGTLVFNGVAVTKGQTLPVRSLEYLKFLPNNETESVFFSFTCDSESYKGTPLRCEIVFGDGINSPPVALDSAISTVAGISCSGSLSINEPNGDEYKVNVITYPTDGFIEIGETGDIVYTPNSDFSGNDSLVYTVTDKFGAVSQRATLSIKVEENESGICFADMADNENHLYAHRMCRDNIMVYRYEDGEYRFDPEVKVTKVEFLVMLMALSGQDTDILAVADSVITDDNNLSSGLKGYISTAVEKGFIKLDNGSFSPNEIITVADAAYMIASVLKLPGVDSESVSSGESDKTFASLLAATNAGIFDTAEPTQTITKSECAEILCRIDDYMTENNMNRLRD